MDPACEAPNLGPGPENSATNPDSDPSQEPETSESTKPPLIVREESGTLSTSSEEGNCSTSLSGSEKAKVAFKSGLHAKLPLLDLDGGSGSVSG